MIEIRNLLNQSLTFQLARQSASIHLSSRERQILRRDEVTAEMRTAASRGFVALANMPEAPRAVTAGDASTNEQTGADVQATEPTTRKRR